MSSQDDLFSFFTVFGLAVFIGLCILLIVLIATSGMILVIYILIDCLIKPFLGTCFEVDLETGVQRGQHQRTRIVAYHAIIPNDVRLTNSEREAKGKPGLKQSAIETLLPKLLVEQGKNKEEGEEDRSRECAICLSGYVVNEECRVFPVCRHMYHAICIDAWLKNHRTCPTCRHHLPSSS